MGNIREQEFVVRLKQEDGYNFRVLFGGKIPDMFMTEPEPLGRGDNPNAGKLLAASIGHCMCASLLFCLQKSRVGVSSMEATVRAGLERNEKGRLRIGWVKVIINPKVDNADRTKRCAEIFEDFCVVSRSIVEGLRIECEVSIDENH